jgi:hypothetical protein
MKRLLCCLVPLLLVACAPRQARYTGTLTPETACGMAGRATLTVMDGRATFAANDGALLVPGEVAPDGTLSGRLVLTGADRKPYPLTLEGTVTEEVATGSYVTPRCRFALLLTRTRTGLPEGVVP